MRIVVIVLHAAQNRIESGAARDHDGERNPEHQAAAKRRHRLSHRPGGFFLARRGADAQAAVGERDAAAERHDQPAEPDFRGERVPVQAQFRAVGTGGLVGEHGVDVLKTVGVDGGDVGRDLLRGENPACGVQVRKTLP